MNNKTEHGGTLVRVSAAIVDRTDEKNPKLLIIDDPEKDEVASGYTNFSRLRKYPAKSVPGGTMVLDQSQQQSREELLRLSLLRETGYNVPLQELSQGILQPYPFLLGRRNPKIIQRIASTSMLFYLDELAQEYQEYIKQKVKKGVAGWQLLAYLDMLFQAKKSHDGNSHYRQHVLAMAHIWNSLLAEWSGEAILWEVNKNNRVTGRVIKDVSRRQKRPLGLTTFGPDESIRIPYTLDKQLYQLLYGSFKPD